MRYEWEKDLNPLDGYDENNLPPRELVRENLEIIFDHFWDMNRKDQEMHLKALRMLALAE